MSSGTSATAITMPVTVQRMDLRGTAIGIEQLHSSPRSELKGLGRLERPELARQPWATQSQLYHGDRHEAV
jgi:hypothetical protein